MEMQRGMICWFLIPSLSCHISVTSVNSTSSIVVINCGASLSVWKDAERKMALWERRGLGRQKEEQKFDWQRLWEWVTHPAPWIWSCRPILGCGDTCICVVMCMYACTPVFTWLNPIAEVTKFAFLAYSPYVCVLEENESSLATKPQHRSQI